MYMEQKLPYFIRSSNLLPYLSIPTCPFSPPNVGGSVGTFQMAAEEGGGKGEGKEDTSGCKKYGIRPSFRAIWVVS